MNYYGPLGIWWFIEGFNFGTIKLSNRTYSILQYYHMEADIYIYISKFKKIKQKNLVKTPIKSN